MFHYTHPFASATWWSSSKPNRKIFCVHLYTVELCLLRLSRCSATTALIGHHLLYVLVRSTKSTKLPKHSFAILPIRADKIYAYFQFAELRHETKITDFSGLDECLLVEMGEENKTIRIFSIFLLSDLIAITTCRICSLFRSRSPDRASSSTFNFIALGQQTPSFKTTENTCICILVMIGKDESEDR